MFCHNCGERVQEGARFCANCGARMQPTDLGSTGSLATGPQMAYVGFWMRLLAWMIDSVVVGVGLSLLRSLFAMADVLTYGFIEDVDWVFLIAPLYFVISTGVYGRTLGKLVLGMMVVRHDGKAPGLGYALLREVVGKFVSVIALFLGFLWIAWSREKQGWHDHMAGTRVIRTA